MDENDKNNLRKQMILYFTFAVCMIILNFIIQKSNQIFFYPYISQNYGEIDIVKRYYLSTNPYNMPELIGSIVAVLITYIVKFLLDKFIVFEKKAIELKETTEELFKYFIFSVLTTIENIGIQFLLTNFLKTPLEISIVIALSIGYFTKFLLDRNYVFNIR